MKVCKRLYSTKLEKIPLLNKKLENHQKISELKSKQFYNNCALGSNVSTFLIGLECSDRFPILGAAITIPSICWGTYLGFEYVKYSKGIEGLYLENLKLDDELIRMDIK